MRRGPDEDIEQAGCKAPSLDRARRATGGPRASYRSERARFARRLENVLEDPVCRAAMQSCASGSTAVEVEDLKARTGSD